MQASPFNGGDDGGNRCAIYSGVFVLPVSSFHVYKIACPLKEISDEVATGICKEHFAVEGDTQSRYRDRLEAELSALSHNDLT